MNGRRALCHHKGSNYFLFSIPLVHIFASGKRGASSQPAQRNRSADIPSQVITRNVTGLHFSADPRRKSTSYAFQRRRSVFFCGLATQHDLIYNGL